MLEGDRWSLMPISREEYIEALERLNEALWDKVEALTHSLAEVDERIKEEIGNGRGN